MRAKLVEREKAIALRRQGLSYSEIRREVKVAKSSLSLWLRPVGLLYWQQQRLSDRKLAAARSGSKKLRDRRVQRVQEAVENGTIEAQEYLASKDIHWVIGVILYWAEGSKSKPWNHAELLSFTNMDAGTILIMERWVQQYCGVKPEDITYGLYVHVDADVRSAQRFWIEKLGIAPGSLRTYFKKHNPSPRRKNVGRGYHGIMRIRVRRSTYLNHRVNGWIQAVGRYCGVVQG